MQTIKIPEKGDLFTLPEVPDFPFLVKVVSVSIRGKSVDFLVTIVAHEHNGRRGAERFTFNRKEWEACNFTLYPQPHPSAAQLLRKQLTASPKKPDPLKNGAPTPEGRSSGVALRAV